MSERQDIHNSGVPMICISCEARHKGVCGALTPEQLTRLSQHTTIVSVPRGKELSPVRNEAGSCANILEGVVKLSKMMADGRQQIVGLQFAPDFIDRPVEADSGVTSEAATQVQLCRFPRHVLEDMVSESPPLEHRLHMQALNELNEARDWLLTLGRKTAAEKLASFLLLVVRNSDPEKRADEDEPEIFLPLTRADMADFLGLTTETVSRQLTNLRKRGMIEIADRRRVKILNMRALRRLGEQSC